MNRPMPPDNAEDPFEEEKVEELEEEAHPSHGEPRDEPAT
jgi:hypothetical protein